MTISSSEYNARIGLLYSGATRILKRKRLDYVNVIFIQLYCVLGIKCVPIMLLYCVILSNDSNADNCRQSYSFSTYCCRFSR